VRSFFRVSIVGVVSIASAACAGRAPEPVAVVQSEDLYMNCAAVFAEVQTNNQKISELSGEQGSKGAQNFAAGVAGFFIFPLWLAMDFQDAAPKEIAALQSRQLYLATLAEQKRCGAGPLPARRLSS
jgi:hypothetical protein